MPTQLLKQSIESKPFKQSYPDIAFNGDQLVGSFAVGADERVELVNLMFAKNRDSYAYASSKPTTINIVSSVFNCEVMRYGSDALSEYFKENLGYDSYIEKSVFANKTTHSLNEEIKTVFSILNGGEIAGFYDFDLSLDHEKGQAMLILNLNQIYVKPQCRGSTYWMDLTIAVYSFVGEVLYNLSNKLSKPHYFDIYVTADFYTKSDEKIAKFIEAEIRSMYQVLPELAPHRPAFIGEVIADMGY